MFVVPNISSCVPWLLRVEKMFVCDSYVGSWWKNPGRPSSFLSVGMCWAANLWVRLAFSLQTNARPGSPAMPQFQAKSVVMLMCLWLHFSYLSSGRLSMDEWVCALSCRFLLPFSLLCRLGWSIQSNGGVHKQTGGWKERVSCKEATWFAFAFNVITISVDSAAHSPSCVPRAEFRHRHAPHFLSPSKYTQTNETIP